MRQLALAVLLTLIACSACFGQEQKPIEIGTLKGQVFAISETGNFHPAKGAQGHLISCEPTRELRPGVGSVTANPCEYFLQAKRQLYPESSYADALSAFLSAFMWASAHHVRDVPFQIDARGFFSVSAVTGSYIVYVDGVAGGHRCIWMLSGVQVGERPVSIQISPRAVVGPDRDSTLITPNVILQTSVKSLT